MKMMLKLIVVFGALASGACAGMPVIPALSSFGLGAEIKDEAPTPENAAMPASEGTEAARKDTVARAAELLAAGKATEARTVLEAVLAASPRDTAAQSFLRQIDIDPVKLLGEASPEPYVVQPGDTMSGLADRFLGDSRLFYALSRYNGLSAPNALAVGRPLKLPASAKRAEPAVTPTPSATSAAPPLASAKANDMRLQALQLLNKGEVDRAITLLTQAVALDPDEHAIRKDLERAQRIQGALTDG